MVFDYFLIHLTGSEGPTAFDLRLYFVHLPQPYILYVEWIWRSSADL
jgi:hypothetical protein